MPVLSADRKALERTFSELYHEPKSVEDLGLDFVIMSPEMLIPLPEPGAPFFWFLSVSCSRDSVSIRSLPNGAVPAPWFPSPVLPMALLLPLSNTKRKGRSSASVPKSSPLPVLSSCTVCLLPGFWDSSTGSSASCNPDRVLL